MARNITSHLTPLRPETPIYTTFYRSSIRVISPPSNQGLTGFFRSLYETISGSIYSTPTMTSTHVKTCLSLPDSGPKIKHVYPLLEEIFQHTLFNLHHITETLQYWEDVSDPIIPRNYLFVHRTLINALMVFLSQLYVEIEFFNGHSVSPLLGAIHGFFLQLQDSVCPINSTCDISPLSFEESPRRNEVNIGSGQNDYDASLIRSHLNKLDLYLSIWIDKYRKPSKVIHPRMRMRYAFGAIGISLVSVWLFRHTSVVRHANESLSRFFTFNVEQPIQRLKELKDETDGLEKHVDDNSGSMLIKALSLGTLIAPWVPKYTKSQSKISRIAYDQRRQLIDEAAFTIEQMQECINWPSNPARFHCCNGFLLCTLDRLLKHAEKDAKALDEWESLQADLFILGNTGVGSLYKLDIISRLKSVYDCLYPPTTISSLSELTVGEEPFQQTPDDCLYTPIPYRVFEHSSDL